MESFNEISPAALFEQAQIGKTKREAGLSQDTAAEYALFARALTQTQEAWQFIYRLYFPNVRTHVRYHRLFGLHGKSADSLADDALTRFWEIFQRNPGKFNAVDFPNFDSIYAYLRSTVYWFMQTLPKEDTLSPAPPTTTLEDEFEVEQRPKQIWGCLEPHLVGHIEQLVMYGLYVIGLRPRELSARFPELLESAETVYKINATVLRRLRGKKRRAALRDCIGDEFLN